MSNLNERKIGKNVHYCDQNPDVIEDVEDGVTAEEEEFVERLFQTPNIYEKDSPLWNLVTSKKGATLLEEEI